MQYRHEIKHEISPGELLVLRQRLRAVLRPDDHAAGGKYRIRSLYFDTPDDRALREKLDGVNEREKFRVRLYDNDPSVIHLERKYKRGGLGYKQTAPLTAQQARALARGETDWLDGADDPLLALFRDRVLHGALRARVLVDYTREAFVYAPGNVRVTLDYDIRTGLRCTELLDPDCVTVPAPGAPCLLEVKWDAYLPDVVRGAVQLGARHAAAYSKYAACRMYD